MVYVVFPLGEDLQDEYRFLVQKDSTLYFSWDDCINDILKVFQKIFTDPNGGKDFSPEKIEDLWESDLCKRFKWSITAECFDSKLVKGLWYGVNGGWNFQFYVMIFELTPVTDKYTYTLNTKFL
jgi:hypothetical protein